MQGDKAKVKSQNWHRRHCSKCRHDSLLDITAWAQEHVQKSPVCEHSSLCNPQTQIKVVSYKEEVICDHDPEMPPPSLGQSSSKMV